MTEDYKLVKFSDAAKKVNKTVNLETTILDKYIGGEHMNTDDLRITEWGVLGDDYLGPAFNKAFKAGQILYGSRRTYLKKVAIPDFDGICSNTTFVIEPTGKGILPELVPFVMHSQAFTDHSIRESKGSTNPYINWKDIAKYEFPIPAAMERQRQIAEVLCEAELSFNKNARFLSLAENYKKIIIHELFSKGIGHTEFKEVERIGIIPAGWNLVNLSSISTIKYGLGQPPSLKIDGHPMIRATDIDHGIIDISKIVRVDPQEIPKNKDPYLKYGDIIVVRSGVNTGDLAMYNLNLSNSLAGYDLIVRPNLNDIEPIYLTHYLLGKVAQRFFKTQSARSAQSHLNSKQLGNTVIPLPPKHEQRQIVTILKQIDKITNLAHMNMESAKFLKFRLINEYFPPKEEVLV